ncbi:MAG: sigma-70 family RNA polymerase sigma factor [Pseudomonadota bacterium]
MQATESDKSRQLRFERIVGTYREDLFRYAYWLNRNRELAEDVVQDALLRAWRSLDSLREDAAAKPWLLTIVRRENARHFERKRLETLDIDELHQAQQAEIAHHENADIDDLRQGMLELADEYREPLVLQVLMGFSTQEIADVMELKSGAVLTRLHRARLQLKKILMPDSSATAEHV